MLKNENKHTNSWDASDSDFDTWWNLGYDGKTNPFTVYSPAYWAWAGWMASKKIERQACLDICDAEAEQWQSPKYHYAMAAAVHCARKIKDRN